MDYTHTLRYNVVGLGVFDGAVIAATEAYPCVITGQDPAASVAVTLPYHFPCTEKKSIISTPYGVIFTTGQGLVVCDGSSARVITAGAMSPADWQTKGFDDAACAWFHERVFGVVLSADTGFIFDPATPDYIIFLDLGITVAGLFVDELADALYFVDTDGDAHLWKGSSSAYLPGTYETSIYTTAPVSLSCGKIDGYFPAGSSIALTITADRTTLVSATAITTADAFRFACDSRYTEWSVKAVATGGAVIYGIHLASTMAELAMVGGVDNG